MNTDKKIIAFILLLGFIIPVIFQSVHILNHNHSCDSHFENCQTTDTSTPNKLTEKDDSCIICDFKFNINQQPKTTNYKFASLSLTSTITPILSNQYNTTLKSHILTRGPPYV